MTMWLVLLIHRDSASNLMLPELEALDAYLDVHDGISKGFPMLLKVVYDEASPEWSWVKSLQVFPREKMETTGE